MVDQGRAAHGQFCDTVKALADRIWQPLVGQGIEERDDQNIRNMARDTSVYLRKLLQDRSALVRMAVTKPTFHLLGGSWRAHKAWEVDGLNGPEGEEEEFESARIEGLPGVRINESGLGYEATTEVFNTTGRVVSLDKWLRQDLLMITSDGATKKYPLGRLVRLVANKEGAHGEVNRKEVDETRVKLGGIHYAHWVTICVAAYIYNRTMNSVKAHGELWEKAGLRNYRTRHLKLEKKGVLGITIEKRMRAVEATGKGYFKADGTGLIIRPAEGLSEVYEGSSGAAQTAPTPERSYIVKLECSEEAEYLHFGRNGIEIVHQKAAATHFAYRADGEDAATMAERMLRASGIEARTDVERASREGRERGAEPRTILFYLGGGQNGLLKLTASGIRVVKVVTGAVEPTWFSSVMDADEFGRFAQHSAKEVLIEAVQRAQKG